MSTFTSAPQNPLILILGATGTGKSNLAIQLAQSFQDASNTFTGAEIVNADAMQLYRGLPIITNKVTSAEQQDVPHHLLDHIELKEEPWTVQQYVKEADRVIQEIRGRDKLPIVVGGTSYYVYNLLFQDVMLEEHESLESTQSTNKETTSYGKDAANVWPILAASTAEIHTKLVEVDPEIARRWHPNDRRKLQRSLEIYLRTGRKASEVYAEQQKRIARSQPEDETLDLDVAEDTANSAGSLRYDAVIFWLEAEDQTLKDRLNTRVDTMIENGLLEETLEMHAAMCDLHERGLPVDMSKGIWVSIGYKEMETWVEALAHQGLQEKDLHTIRSNCVEAVKAATRQYAKRQNRFIRLRLANTLASTNSANKLFLLDCTDLECWQTSVLQPALNIVNNFLTGDQLPNPSDLSPMARQTFSSMTNNDDTNQRAARRCETCDKVLMTEREWTNHINSRSHKKILQGSRKRELNEARRKAAGSNHANDLE